MHPRSKTMVSWRTQNKLRIRRNIKPHVLDFRLSILGINGGCAQLFTMSQELLYTLTHLA